MLTCPAYSSISFASGVAPGGRYPTGWKDGGWKDAGVGSSLQQEQGARHPIQHSAKVTCESQVMLQPRCLWIQTKLSLTPVFLLLRVSSRKR